MEVTTGSDFANTFSTAKVVAWIIFGAIGMVVLVYGKKHSNLKPMLVGIALMVYPYFFTSALWIYGIGIGMCLLLLWRD